MTSDPSSPTQPPSAETPTASLAGVPVSKRRAAMLSKKRGDITHQLTGESGAAAPADPPRDRKPAAPTSAPPSAAPAPKAVPKLTVEPRDENTTPAPPIPRLTVDPQDKADANSSEAPRESIDEIIDYWDNLRGDRAFPSLSDIDRDFIARTWRNCILLAVGNEEAGTKITRLGEPNGEVEYTAMVTDWILSRGRHSAVKGEALEEEKRFPITKGHARYRLLLLPLSNDGINCENILCHVCRGEELSAGAAFKRWLNS